MVVNRILSELSNKNLIIISAEDLLSLLSEVQILKEEDTHLCDLIRILSFNETILIQEKSNKNEIILRKFSSLDKAEEFLQERLAYYERKWDGCGCKVDYYS
jgi:hypothetical protein